MSDELLRLRRLLRTVLVGSLLGAVVLLAVAIVLKSFGELRTQVLFTLIGLVTGAIAGDIALGCLAEMPRRSRATLWFIIGSQVWFYLLVWTPWKKNPILWRSWWFCMVASVAFTHLLALGRAAALRRDGLARGTTMVTAIAGLLMATLAFSRSLPPEPGPVFIWSYGIAAGLSIAGSSLLWRRWARRNGPPEPMARWARMSWILGSHAAIFMIGWYIGGAGVEPPSVFEIFPSSLAAMSPEQIDAQVRVDLEKLRGAVSGLAELREKAAGLHAEMATRRKADRREFYTPEEDDRVRWHFVSYLSLRSALLRLVATYAGFGVIKSPETRARCFMVGFGSAAAAFEHALVFLEGYGNDPLLVRKLNEREPLWGLDAGLLDQIRASVTSSRTLEKFDEMSAYYDFSRDGWRGAGAWSESEFAWLDDLIARSTEYVRTHGLSRTKAWFAALARRVKEDTYRPIYAAQSMASTMIGHFRIVQDAPLISVDQIRQEVRPRLKPGDILLERRNWFMSNAFLPGFWPHTAIYVGTIEDLRRLQIDGHPLVRAHLDQYLKPTADGEPHTVIEAVSQGVIFSRLSDSLHADYVAVLRPRLTEAQVAEAIVRAFSHQGKPYDFEFDFFTSDKLVCTELVYRSYEGLIHFDLVRVMGRDTLPAVEIVRKFARERGSDRRQFDLVLFLDGDPASGCARPADEEVFCGTITRERAFTE